jgi:hypothetical protein
MEVEKEKEPDYKKFALEIKDMVRNLGRSNIIIKSHIEELIVKYNIK